MSEKSHIYQTYRGKLVSVCVQVEQYFDMYDANEEEDLTSDFLCFWAARKQHHLILYRLEMRSLSSPEARLKDIQTLMYDYRTRFWTEEEGAIATGAKKEGVSLTFSSKDSKS